MTGIQPQGLKRVLTLRDLLIYGMIILQVVGPLPTFGFLAQRSNNHAVLTALIALVPMLITAISYGRMAHLYPMAGSAYTYVGRSLNPHLGFMVGWAMCLDYGMILVISALIPGLAIQRVLPGAPLPALAFLIIAAMTALNLGGIRATLRANKLLLATSTLAVAAFIALSVRYLALRGGWGSVLSSKPIYDPATFDPRTILSGISLAAITYIGFDGVTTLAEDSVNPKRDMVLATVLVALMIGLLCALELYFLQSVLPDWHGTDANTSYLDVMTTVGGPILFASFLIVMSVSQFGSGLGIQVNVARLLYGMGRDGVLPRQVFGQLSARRRHPSRNMVWVGAMAFIGTLMIPFEHALDLLNFGAFLGFMGVNLATLISYYLRPHVNHARNLAWDFVLPLSGFLGCLIFWLGLPERAKLVGGVWLLVGFLYCVYKTRGFRERPLLFDFQEM